MIDIIIPAYNAHDYIENAIFSIITQTMKNKINVYIVNDCSDKNYSDIVKKYKSIISIKEIKTKKNSGPGVARQLGVDNSNSQFIVFMDADDIFNSCYAIERLYDCIVSKKKNAVSSYFVEEIEDGLYDHFDNSIWVHGKIYRRSFLEKNRIRFNNTRANEDTGFNKLIELLDEFEYMPEYTYIWKLNNSSLTRSGDYNFYGLEGFVYNICWAIEEGAKRGANKNKMAKLAYENLLEMYYRYIYYKDRKEKSLLLEWTYKLKEYYIKYINYISEEEKIDILKNEANKFICELGSDEFINNKLTFNEFLELLKT